MKKVVIKPLDSKFQDFESSISCYEDDDDDDDTDCFAVDQPWK